MDREFPLPTVNQDLIATESGLPSANILFSTLQAISASVFCAPDVRARRRSGPSLIRCYYAAIGKRVSRVRRNHHATTVPLRRAPGMKDPKMSRKVYLLGARPACIAGVRTSRPKRSDECGRIKL